MMLATAETLFIFIGGLLLTTGYPQSDFVFPQDKSSGRFDGFGGSSTQQVQGQNNPVTSDNGQFTSGKFVSGFGPNEGATQLNGISSGQFTGFGGPATQQVQGQNNPVTSDNGQFASGKFVSGFGPNEGATQVNGISSGQFTGFGGPGTQPVQGQNNPVTSDDGQFASGNFVSGFGPNDGTTFSGISHGQFSGFGVPGTQQVQGQNNPAISDNSQFASGKFVSGFGPYEGATNVNGISSGQFAGFGGPGIQQVQGQNNPVTSDNGRFASGRFVSGFGRNEGRPIAGNNRPSRQVQWQNNLIPGFETTTSSPSTPRPAPTQQFLFCMQQCLTTSEYNPVCGSDGQSYHNAARLQCSQRCGSGISQVRRGTCQALGR